MSDHVPWYLPYGVHAVEAVGPHLLEPDGRSEPPLYGMAYRIDVTITDPRGGRARGAVMVDDYLLRSSDYELGAYVIDRLCWEVAKHLGWPPRQHTEDRLRRDLESAESRVTAARRDAERWERTATELAAKALRVSE